jgi:hypothetical protein
LSVNNQQGVRKGALFFCRRISGGGCVRPANGRSRSTAPAAQICSLPPLIIDLKAHNRHAVPGVGKAVGRVLILIFLLIPIPVFIDQDYDYELRFGHYRRLISLDIFRDF